MIFLGKIGEKIDKNLKKNKSEIIKIRLPQKEFLKIIFISIVLSLILFLILKYLNDKHPLLDSLTTILSISGMYLTVKRAIQQWIFWMIVNLFSLLMWINIALTGEKVYSTILMWGIYLILAIYFYINWNKEIKEYKES